MYGKSCFGFLEVGSTPFFVNAYVLHNLFFSIFLFMLHLGFFLHMKMLFKSDSDKATIR
jgi:hypothetical protein